MNAFEMLHEYGRLCDYQTGCDKCPLIELGKYKLQSCQQTLRYHTEEAAEIIEKWAKEHPKKTRLQDFLEKHPNAITEEDGSPRVCCLHLRYVGKCPANCDKCWNEPI